MKGERILRTLILAMAGLALFGMFRPSSPDPIEDSGSRKSWFFINKTHQGANYDAVIIGDSRALRAVSAQALGDSLGGMRIYNFSFHAGGMNREMFQEAEKLLDDKSQTPTVIFAPTAVSFLPFKARNAQFHEYRDKPRDQVWIYRHFPGLAHWFQPVAPSIFAQKILKVQPPRLLEQEFNSDGWIDTDQIPWDDLADLSIHRLPLVGRNADETIIRGFMGQTREWTGRGIKVFGFFPPADESRVVQEDSMLGFNRETFIKSFRDAGGIWLDISRTGYESYDGSHLVGASALKLSRDLSREMAPFF
ncbi:MAG: hypothetical protein KAH24_07895 [Holophagae bacterium]|nr:hypothetical protein [Holophagae bacterium]